MPALLPVPTFNSLLQRRISTEEFAGKKKVCYQHLPHSSKIAQPRLSAAPGGEGDSACDSSSFLL